MTNGDQIKLVLLQVELIDNSEITHPQPKSIHSLHPIMWSRKVTPQDINPIHQPSLHIQWQAEKSPVKLGGIDLRRRPG